jgi:hypothetical protein
LELEENDRINGRATTSRIEWSNKVAYKGKVEGLVEVTVEMVSRDKLLDPCCPS